MPQGKKTKKQKTYQLLPYLQSELEAKKPEPYAFKYNYPLKYMQSFSSAL